MGNKPKLLNSRGYLSHTQVDMWVRSPERYVQQYMYGAKQEVNSRMDFGSKVAMALETEEASGDMMIDALVALLPKYSNPEHQIYVDFETKDGVVSLLGKLDSFHPEKFWFREYKTGTMKWTQRRADKHPQIDHYAAMIWLKHGVVPERIHLDWAETEFEGEEVVLTGKIQTFEVKKTLPDILGYLAIVSKVAKEIDQRYRKEFNIIK